MIMIKREWSVTELSISQLAFRANPPRRVNRIIDKEKKIVEFKQS